MELARGIEPPTCGLQNRCSAIELRQPARNITYLRARCQPAEMALCQDCVRRVPGVGAWRPACPIRPQLHTADRCSPFFVLKSSWPRIEVPQPVPYF
jgi:hypothetical protein